MSTKLPYTSTKLLYISTKFAWGLAAWLACVSATYSQTTSTAPIAPRPAAHAHNDYLHPRPLQDALDQGFCSVEADVFLIDGKLLVAHSRPEVTKDRTLESLYLEPLKARIAANGGQVYAGGPTFGLLIDLKSEAESTYLAVHAALSRYADLFTSVVEGKVKPGPVQVTISGNRPQELIAAQKVRYCGIDGRLSDLDSDKPAHLMPMISDNWTMHFQWRGVGEMPEPERQKLQTIVRQAHAQGRVVRFWASPELPTVWKELKAAGVDRINTDKLSELSNFLRE